MFNNLKLKELLSDDVYTFNVNERVWEFSSYDEPLYLIMYDDLLQYAYISDDWRESIENQRKAENEFIHYFDAIVFNKVSPILPLVWLSYSRWALLFKYVPSDFRVWALELLEWFDLERYNTAYQLSEEEYKAIQHDLPIIIDKLKNYPINKLAPPIGDKF